MSLCGLVETRVKECNKDAVLKADAKDWKVFCNYQYAPNGRIWVCWNPNELDVSLVDFSGLLRQGIARDAGKS